MNSVRTTVLQRVHVLPYNTSTYVRIQNWLHIRLKKVRIRGHSLIVFLPFGEHMCTKSYSVIHCLKEEELLLAAIITVSIEGLPF